jgi:hypothetical protein
VQCHLGPVIRIVGVDGSLAPSYVVLELEFVVDVDGELCDERFHWFEGVFQVREGREGRQVVSL